MSTWTCRTLVAIVGLSICAGVGLAEEAPPANRVKEPVAAGVDNPPKLSEDELIERYLGREDPQRYMRLHHRISWRFSNWTAFAEKIGDSGDAFTLYMLKSKSLAELKPEQHKLRKQIIERIEKQRGKNPDQLRVEEVGTAVRNMLYGDVYCNPTQFTMLKWLQGQFRSQSKDPRMRKRLEELRGELQKLLKPDPEDDSDFLERRLLQSVELLL